MNDSDEICSRCNGSGEGQYDGTTCGSCKGAGVERCEHDEGEAADHYYDMKREERYFENRI